jgi:hypothetical protein
MIAMGHTMTKKSVTAMLVFVSIRKVDGLFVGVAVIKPECKDCKEYCRNAVVKPNVAATWSSKLKAHHKKGRNSGNIEDSFEN